MEGFPSLNQLGRMLESAGAVGGAPARTGTMMLPLLSTGTAPFPELPPLPALLLKETGGSRFRRPVHTIQSKALALLKKRRDRCRGGCRWPGR